MGLHYLRKEKIQSNLVHNSLIFNQDCSKTAEFGLWTILIKLSEFGCFGPVLIELSTKSPQIMDVQTLVHGQTPSPRRLMYITHFTSSTYSPLVSLGLLSACSVPAQCLLSACSLLAHCLLIACSLLAHCLLIACSLLAHCLLISCSLLAHCLLIACSLLAHCLLIACSLLAHPLLAVFILCSSSGMTLRLG
jgi:hypothetical protein